MHDKTHGKPTVFWNLYNLFWYCNPHINVDIYQRHTLLKGMHEWRVGCRGRSVTRGTNNVQQKGSECHCTSCDYMCGFTVWSFLSGFSVGQFLSCSEWDLSSQLSFQFLNVIERKWSCRGKSGYRAVFILAAPPVPMRDHPHQCVCMHVCWFLYGRMLFKEYSIVMQILIKTVMQLIVK